MANMQRKKEASKCAAAKATELTPKESTKNTEIKSLKSIIKGFDATLAEPRSKINESRQVFRSGCNTGAHRKAA